MMQNNLGSPRCEKQVQMQSRKEKEQDTARSRPNTSFPVYRMPSTVSRLSHFWLLPFALCLLPSSFSFAAERPHLITQWENFTTANGMPDAKVFCVAVDGSRVWAGTEDGLVLIENGKVQKVYKPEDGLAHRVVMGIAVDHETGDLWISTFGGVSHLSGGRFENFANLTSGLLNDICYGIAVQGKFVWVTTTAGISRHNKDTGEWTDWSEKNAPFHEPWTYGVVPAPELGKVYFAMWGGGLIEYDDKQGYMKAYTDPDEEMEIVLFKNQGLIHIIVSGVAWNHESKMVWASTYFGLSGYDGRNWHNYLTKDSGLASDFINSPKSRGNEVWACTDKGLSMLDYQTNTWVTYRPSKPSDQGHEAPGFSPARAALKGGATTPKTTALHGEIEITWPDGKKEKLSTPTALAHNYILSMDFQGEDIWVATAQGLSHGIHQLQKETQLYANARNSRTTADGTPSHSQKGN
jgi:ligand-binding sensor domain-containing protein